MISNPKVGDRVRYIFRKFIGFGKIIYIQEQKNGSDHIFIRNASTGETWSIVCEDVYHPTEEDYFLGSI